MKVLLVSLLAAVCSACSSTSVITPTFMSSNRETPLTESTLRATNLYQQCVRDAASKMPSWNQRGGTAAQAASAAIDSCKPREQQLYDVVLEDNRGSASPKAMAETYVKDTREKLFNALAMEFMQMRR